MGQCFIITTAGRRVLAQMVPKHDEALGGVADFDPSTRLGFTAGDHEAAGRYGGEGWLSGDRRPRRISCWSGGKSDGTSCLESRPGRLVGQSAVRPKKRTARTRQHDVPRGVPQASPTCGELSPPLATLTLVCARIRPRSACPLRPGLLSRIRPPPGLGNRRAQHLHHLRDLGDSPPSSTLSSPPAAATSFRCTSFKRGASLVTASTVSWPQEANCPTSAVAPTVADSPDERLEDVLRSFVGESFLEVVVVDAETSARLTSSVRRSASAALRSRRR